MRSTTTHRTLALAALAGVALSACSGGADDPATTGSTTTPSSQASGAPSGGGPADASAPDASAGESAEPSPGASSSSSTGDASGAPSGSPAEAAPKGTSFTVVATGDVLVHSDVIKQAKANAGGKGYDFAPMFAQVKPWLAGGDVAICNQETPLSPDNTNLTQSMKIAVFNTPHEQADALAGAGIDACSTSNNHTLDQGVDGIRATRKIMEDAGVTPIGPAADATGGQQGDGSDNPVLVKAGDRTVGVVTYSYNVANAGLSPSLPSHPWMEKHMWMAQGKKGIEAQARKAREQGADVVVAVMHWGAEYSIPPRPEQEDMAHQLLEGDQVDAIVGHHAHLPQPCATINDKTVFYGLGNFLSAQRKKPTNSFPPQVQDGMIAGITFTADGKGGWDQKASYQPTLTTQPAFEVAPVSETQHPESFARTKATIERLGAASCHAEIMQPQG
ncbi:CapA family protein [Kytococcus schroeteri]|uniref:CapA family protein n=1 Tax=Kytococcus schroeteri TaxID=138300 RepID=UPI001141FA84|nr:CapA family protein [Kytococcus schroeteri]